MAVVRILEYRNYTSIEYMVYTDNECDGMRVVLSSTGLPKVGVDRCVSVICTATVSRKIWWVVAKFVVACNAPAIDHTGCKVYGGCCIHEGK